MEEAAPENAEFSFQTVGERLKAERERRGWTMDDIAARTRIPIRHLESLEKSNFSKIPGTTYALGFARSYARAMEMDEVKLGTDLRAELAEAGQSSYPVPSQNYEPADPSSVPSKMLAWTAAAIGVLIFAGYIIFRSFSVGAADEPVEAPVAVQQQAATVPGAAADTSALVADANGEVVIAAIGTVWIKIYDADKKRLFEAEMKAGDKYTVPPSANGPMIVTARPALLNITVAGKAVAPLGTEERTISDVGVSAKALAARASSPANSTPEMSPTTSPKL